MFCGIFDGHGPWGHYVAKRVCDSMPSSLLCNWQEMLLETSNDPKRGDGFHLWKSSFKKTCADVDLDLQHSRKFDSFHSGTTALAVVKQVVFLPHKSQVFIYRMKLMKTNKFYSRVNF